MAGPDRSQRDRPARPAPTRVAYWSRWPALAPLAPTPEFDRSLNELAIKLEPEERRQLGRYLALVLDTCRDMNLTAEREPASAWIRLILDALTLMPLLHDDLPPDASLMDVGSGGGLPGMPLAIVRPTLRVTLVESRGTKADFLRRAADHLGLNNVTVEAGRAEQLARQTGTAGRVHRERYDVVVARALGPMPVAAELTIPFARVSGWVLLIRGSRAEAELALAREAVRALGAEHAGTHVTPTGRVVVLEKRAPTPLRFPRPPRVIRRSVG